MTAPTRESIPPYASYRTFRNFIEWLREGIPDRVDRSFWEQRLNGSNGVQVMTSLRVLGLINAENRPTMTLEQLVHSEGDARKQALRAILEENYPGVFQLPLGRATFSQLRDVFRARAPKDSVLNKCIAFFVQAAQDAGIELSAHILKGTRTPRSPTISKANTRPARRNLRAPEQPESASRNGSSEEQVLPKLDPALSGILVRLPQPGPLDPTTKDAFKRAWDTVFDLVYPTRKDPQ